MNRSAVKNNFSDKWLEGNVDSTVVFVHIYNVVLSDFYALQDHSRETLMI